jgi:hypothetical protein
VADNRRRVNSTYTQNNQRGNTYIEGNTIRKMQAQPVRREEYGLPKRQEPARVPEPKRKPKTLSREVQRNRENAKSINLIYVTILMAAAVVLVLTCARYIDIQSEMINIKKSNTVLENEITNLKLINDATYNTLVSSVNLEEIKRIALEELGMMYVSEGQVILYNNQDTDYVRQYKAVE